MNRNGNKGEEGTVVEGGREGLQGRVSVNFTEIDRERKETVYVTRFSGFSAYLNPLSRLPSGEGKICPLCSRKDGGCWGRTEIT